MPRSVSMKTASTKGCEHKTGREMVNAGFKMSSRRSFVTQDAQGLLGVVRMSETEEAEQAAEIEEGMLGISAKRTGVAVLFPWCRTRGVGSDW